MEPSGKNHAKSKRLLLVVAGLLVLFSSTTLLAGYTTAAALRPAGFITRSEPRPLPASFYGTVTPPGQNVPEETLVSAWINGVQYAVTATILADNLSVCRLDVPGDIADTPEVEGGHRGDTIRFQITGFDADQTAGWHSGTYTPLNLSANAGPVPPVAQEQFYLPGCSEQPGR